MMCMKRLSKWKRTMGMIRKKIAQHPPQTKLKKRVSRRSASVLRRRMKSSRSCNKIRRNLFRIKIRLMKIRFYHPKRNNKC